MTQFLSDAVGKTACYEFKGRGENSFYDCNKNYGSFSLTKSC